MTLGVLISQDTTHMVTISAIVSEYYSLMSGKFMSHSCESVSLLAVYSGSPKFSRIKLLNVAANRKRRPQQNSFFTLTETFGHFLDPETSLQALTTFLFFFF